jgi:sulfur transfer complex TusBCD TusB component (DsrH family)
MKVLQVVSSAYRATIEEQDDTILWLTQAMRNAGGEVDVLLTENAVNYAVQGQDASGLNLGAWKQTQPPCIDDDVARMLDKGVGVMAIAEDLQERGLAGASMTPGIGVVSRSEAAALLAHYDQVWRW